MSNPVSAITGGLSLVSGLSGARAARGAANSQSQSAAGAQAQQSAQYQQARTDTAPYRASGEAANNLLSQYLGTAPQSGGIAATAGKAAFTPLSYQDWEKANPGTYTPQDNQSWNISQGFGVNGNVAQYNPNSSANAPSPNGYNNYLNSNPATSAVAANSGTQPLPNSQYGSLLRPFSQNDLNNDVVYNTGLDFGLNQGTKAIDRISSARGGFESGATLKALADYANDYGSQKASAASDRFVANKDQTYNFLNNVANRGVNSVAAVTGAGQNAANNISSSLEGAGNAQAAGRIGAANAYSSALGGLARQIPSNASVFNPQSTNNYSSVPNTQYNFTTGGTY